MMMMNNQSRKNLSDSWGPEIVAQCCRYWKLHYADGNWGRCGLCHNRPHMVNLSWDQIDQIQGEKNELNI